MVDHNEIASVILTLCTALGGFLLSELSSLIRDHRSLKREREARYEARGEQMKQRRTEFQRQTLLDLQDSLAKLVRATGQGHHLDDMASRASGQWQKQLWGDDLDERYRLAQVQTSLLGVRVANEDVRNDIEELKAASSKTALSPSKASADAELERMARAYERVNRRIGDLLRGLDSDDDLTG